jgi:hypothetical protein
MSWGNWFSTWQGTLNTRSRDVVLRLLVKKLGWIRMLKTRLLHAVSNQDIHYDRVISTINRHAEKRCINKVEYRTTTVTMNPHQRCTLHIIGNNPDIHSLLELPGRKRRWWRIENEHTQSKAQREPCTHIWYASTLGRWGVLSGVNRKAGNEIYTLWFRAGCQWLMWQVTTLKCNA